MTTAINVALPSIQTEFHLGAVALGWLPLAYVLASAVFILPFGKMGDRLGRRLVFLVGLGVFTIGSMGAVFADSYTPLLLFRVTQGLGGSMIFSTSMAMVALAYPPEKRGWAMGISVAAAYLGQTTGPLIGGVIVYHIGWHNLFLVTGCFALFILVLDLWLLRRTEWKSGEEGMAGFDSDRLERLRSRALGASCWDCRGSRRHGGSSSWRPVLPAWPSSSGGKRARGVLSSPYTCSATTECSPCPISRRSSATPQCGP